MDLYELTGGAENHPVYQTVVEANGHRHYQFLFSIIQAALEIQRPVISQAIIKAINFHAIAGLHYTAGAYRPCEVVVHNAADGVVYTPPQHHRVQALMDDFVNMVNWRWQSADSIELAAYSLWRINHIHPFINGNGRTARAVCYFVLCVKSGGLLPGNEILPELLRRNGTKDRYRSALQEADRDNLAALVELIRELVVTQIASSNPVPVAQ